MIKQIGFVAACLVASLGCENKKSVSSSDPAHAVAETTKGATSTSLVKAPAAGNDKWVTIKGKIVWDKAKGAARQAQAHQGHQGRGSRRQGQRLQHGRLGRESEERRNQERGGLASAGTDGRADEGA